MNTLVFRVLFFCFQWPSTFCMLTMKTSPSLQQFVSRKFVSTGRRFCLFVCYGEQICTQLWMVEGTSTFNGGLRSRTIESKIKSRIAEQCMHVYFIFILFINFRR
jgi:hypothetical protein